jgi:4-hydroxybenzoate polyprenyltransferase
MNLPKLVRADFGSDLVTGNRYSFAEKLAGFSTLVRPIFLVMTPLNAASAAILSIRSLPSWQLCIAGFFTGALAAAGVNTFNQYTDAERDRNIWPSRPIPSGRVSKNQAAVLAILFYILSLALCWAFFNPVAFSLLLAAIILGSLYSSHLRDKVGYLTLPPIEGLIFLTGWAALSPNTVFTNLLPWYLFLLGLVWQSAHILAHYVLVMRYDNSASPVIETPAFFSQPSAQLASRATLGLDVLLLSMSLVLPLMTSLSYLYFIPVALYGIYTIYQCRTFSRKSWDKNQIHRAWSSLSLFRMLISLAMIISILFYP